MVKSRIALGLFVIALMAGAAYATRPAEAGWVASEPPRPVQPQASALDFQNDRFWRVWLSPVNLSQSPADIAIFPTLGLAPDNKTLYIAWSDGRDAVDNIYYTSSTDGGHNWSGPQPFWDSAQESARPSLLMSGTVPYVAWVEAIDYVNRETHVMALGDTQPITVPNDYKRFAATPHLTQDPSGEFHLALQGGQSNETDVLYTHWREGMTSWPPATVVVTHTVVGAANPSIAVDDQAIHLVWQERISSNDSQVYYMRGQRNGSQINWEEPLLLSDPTVLAVRPAIVLGPDSIHIAWGEQLDPDRYKQYLPILSRAGQTFAAARPIQDAPPMPEAARPMEPQVSFVNRQYVRHTWSTNGGDTWIYPLRVAHNAVSTNDIVPTDVAPALAVGPPGSNVICIAWHGFYLGVLIEAEEIYLTCSIDQGRHWGMPVNVSQSPNLISIRPSIALGNDGAVHIAWQELADETADPLEEYQILYAHSLPYANMLPIVQRNMP